MKYPSYREFSSTATCMVKLEAEIFVRCYILAQETILDRKEIYLLRLHVCVCSVHLIETYFLRAIEKRGLIEVRLVRDALSSSTIKYNKL